MSNGFSLDDSTLEALLGNKPDFSNSGLSVSRRKRLRLLSIDYLSLVKCLTSMKKPVS